MYLVISKNGKRLCKDNKFREFAMFGTFGSCIKQYKNLGHAKRKADRTRWIDCEVVEIPEGYDVDASGNVYHDVPSDKPGFINTIRQDLHEFVVHTPNHVKA